MSKSSGTIKATLGIMLAVFLLTSCGPTEYNGFKIVKQDGVQCLELPLPETGDTISGSATVTIPLSFYLIAEAHLKNFADIYDRFNIEADDTIAFYEDIANRIQAWDSSLLLGKERKSFERWKKSAGKSADSVLTKSAQNPLPNELFVKKYSESMKLLAGILKKLGRQEPLLNTSFAAEDFFNENGRSREIKEAAAFVSKCFPGVKIIEDFSERTRFNVDESRFVEFPVAASINKEGEATLISTANLRTFKMPVLFYEKLHSIAQTLAKNYNYFSKTDKQIVTELFESSSELNKLVYNLLDFFPTDSDKEILLDWLRYIVSLDREEALFLTGGLAAFCRAQWLYSYRIISVLDDLNWNFDTYENETEAAKKTWNDYVHNNQDLVNAIAFYENTFPDIAFKKNFDDKIF